MIPATIFLALSSSHHFANYRTWLLWSTYERVSNSWGKLHPREWSSSRWNPSDL